MLSPKGICVNLGLDITFILFNSLYITERRISGFITPILKSLVVPVIWLALIGAIYSWITPFFVLNHIFFPANEEATLKTKQPIRFQGLQKITNQIAGKRKMKDNEYHEANFATFVSKSLIFPPQKWMNLISNQLSTALNWPSPVLWRFQNGCNNMNPVLGNFGLKSYLWFQIELMLRPCSILKSCMWFQPILHSTRFNYHYKSLLNQSGLHK